MPGSLRLCFFGCGRIHFDLVFGSHSLIAENGRVLGESRRVGDGLHPVYFETTDVTCDVDLQQLARERRAIGTFGDARQKEKIQFRSIEIANEKSFHLRKADGASRASTAKASSPKVRRTAGNPTDRNCLGNRSASIRSVESSRVRFSVF